MKIKFLANIALGLFIGVELTLVFALSLDLGFREEVQTHLSLFYSATISLLAAFFAVAGVLTNIDFQSSEAEKQRIAKLQAAKSTLPLTLSQLITACRRAVEISLNINCTGRPHHELISEIELSDLVLASLKECIEFADENSARRLANIVRHYQILLSRIHEQESNQIVSTQRSHAAINWAVLYRLVEDCFEYARGETNTIPQELTNRHIYSIFSVILMIDVASIEGLHLQITNHQNAENLELF